MKIKICGITNLEDALCAVEAGADMLGFNFYPKSPRYLTPEVCTVIQSKIVNRKPSTVCVGVFVNSSPEEVVAILNQTGLHLAQLSGDESLADLIMLEGRAFKAVRLSSTDSQADKRMGTDIALETIMEYAGARRGWSPALLVDASVKGVYGGTGVMANWQAAAELAKRAPILLAGGLTPDNVAAAVRQVRPWGVDVASGVEASPGKKDAAKVRQFIQNARKASKEIIQIMPASRADLPEVLALQKLAYQSEAELNNDFNIPPLTQTLAGIEEEFAGRTFFLKAVMDGRLVGSVRAHFEDGTCHIGRLIVHPDQQNQGIGSRLMKEVEGRFTRVERFELFTSERSARNLYLYQKLGYKVFRQEQLSEKINLVYLEKTGGLS